MSAKAELLAAEERAWRELCGLIEGVPPDRLATPGLNGDWSVKDLMAHIAAWHALTTDRLESLRATGELPPAPDVDRFNEERYLECKEVSLADIQAMFGASRHRYREEVALAEEPFTERVATVIAANGHAHYAEHVADLRSFMEVPAS